MDAGVAWYHRILFQTTPTSATYQLDLWKAGFVPGTLHQRKQAQCHQVMSTVIGKKHTVMMSDVLSQLNSPKSYIFLCSTNWVQLSKSSVKGKIQTVKVNTSQEFSVVLAYLALALLSSKPSPSSSPWPHSAQRCCWEPFKRCGTLSIKTI